MHKRFSKVRFKATGASAFVALIGAGWFGATYIGSAKQDTKVIIHGVVAGSYFTPPAGSTPSSTIASTYEHARVCADDNDNAVCDQGEDSTFTDSTGAFVLQSRGPVIAEISTESLNAGHRVTGRLVMRASLDQILSTATQNGKDPDDNGHPFDPAARNNPTQKSTIAITPLTTETVRMMETGKLPFATARQKLSARLGVLTTEVLADPNA